MRLDNWINLNMDPLVASQIVSLRPALESLVIRASNEPEQVMELSPLDLKVHRPCSNKLFTPFLFLMQKITKHAVV